MSDAFRQGVEKKVGRYRIRLELRIKVGRDVVGQRERFAMKVARKVVGRRLPEGRKEDGYEGRKRLPKRK